MTKIKSKYITINSISFQPVTSKIVIDGISTLDDIKSSGGDILKDKKIFRQTICKWIDDSVKAGSFSDSLKLATITPMQ